MLLQRVPMQRLTPASWSVRRVVPACLGRTAGAEGLLRLVAVGCPVLREACQEVRRGGQGPMAAREGVAGCQDSTARRSLEVAIAAATVTMGLVRAYPG